MSHPMWVRGLKLIQPIGTINYLKSHPMWVRGLKQSRGFSPIFLGGRTPCGCVD